MSAFYEALEAEIEATRRSDRQIRVVDAIYMDIEGAEPWRMAGVEGTLITPDGERWSGWVVNGEAKMTPPKITDIRDGSSPLYEFTVGYIDEETYLRLRDDKDKVKGRLLIVYSIYLSDNSLRATVPPGDAWRLRMKSTRFVEKIEKDGEGGYVRRYVVSVIAKNINEGRSRAYFGTMSDTGQRARSEQLFGIEGDAYGQFIPKYAGGYTINLDA
jgi:hypothetical protein